MNMYRDILSHTSWKRRKPPDYDYKGLFYEGKKISLGERFSRAHWSIVVVDESVGHENEVAWNATQGNFCKIWEVVATFLLNRK